MFNKEQKIETIDHTKLPKPYTAEELRKLNEAREVERKEAAAKEAGEANENN